MRIKCQTLFDITNTGISFRRNNLESELDLSHDVEKMRNQQSNFETILQIIGLRSQPENISIPVQKSEKGDIRWGSIYKNKKISVWTFEFTVNNIAVFRNNDDELEFLYKDCQNVPMIINLDENKNIDSILRIDSDNKNIYFEVLND